MPVYTVALGTENGTIQGPDGYGGIRTIRVPPDPDDAQRRSRRRPAASSSQAADADALKSVYDEIGSQVGVEHKHARADGRSSPRAGAALLLLGGGAVDALVRPDAVTKTPMRAPRRRPHGCPLSSPAQRRAIRGGGMARTSAHARARAPREGARCRRNGSAITPAELRERRAESAVHAPDSSWGARPRSARPPRSDRRRSRARSRAAGSAPRVAIVGAGIAGLNAALTLQDKGIASTVYEASDRVGGRMHSDRSGYWDGRPVQRDLRRADRHEPHGRARARAAVRAPGRRPARRRAAGLDGRRTGSSAAATRVEQADADFVPVRERAQERPDRGRLPDAAGTSPSRRASSSTG